ncbi:MULTISPECIES: diguanylate cyclase [Paracoccus]|uniref:GGDEF domain-containing protein n=1 Tax=Paracoccus TaxID=265 RepID=UPI00086C0FF5|nr:MULTISPECIES: diguanylate cyclase [Paracoccus]ODT60516.1 MAG: diguanylate cyclase response regulator [Paracoccus sp. SCN 68-21]
MDDRPTILVIDDEPANIEIVSAVLEDDYEICFALSAEQAIQVAHAARPDLILLDVVMPGMDGYQLCRIFKADPLLCDVPVIFATALGDDEAELRGLAVGAIDYVTKPIRPATLLRRVRNHVQMKRMRDQLTEQALRDPLTGLGNRRMLERRLQAELHRQAREGGLIAVLMLDIDHFKGFNDSYGHPEGDRCLQAVSASLAQCVRRSGDLCARYGGEEFACILPGTDLDGALSVAEAMRAGVQALGIAHRASQVAPVVTVSIGVASGRCDMGSDNGFWLTGADRMLYRSKLAGRNRVSGQAMTAEPDARGRSQCAPDGSHAPAPAPPPGGEARTG